MKAPALRRRIGATLIASTFAVALPALAQNAAVVNNKPIPQKRVDDFVEMLKQQGRPDSPELRAAVREELIARELFMQEAEKSGLARSADVQRQLDQAKQDILIRALIRDYVKKHPIKDEDIAAEYEKIKTQFSGEKEYRARHILVEKEDEAKAVIAQIKKGAKFEDIAKKQSKDPGSGAQGGDLGWANPSGYVPEFADALGKLAKGQMTEAPVKSQFGWHVIRVDDVRDAKAPELPSFDAVKPQIVQQLQQQKLVQFQQELRGKAKVE